MKQVNTYEARTHLSQLLRRVAAGEEITIANRGVPVARMVPVSTKKSKRKLGFYGDAIKISGDFDAPLPGEILDAFEGKEKRTSRKT
ncbi:MAG TPA: type II toxin-antitoxin system Phd/YefM family antitoxin [Candidatus Angelobacter sp.]|nr:type II toxin-antitoxin system Phd/YefM family antitoxin [Candidatus Angelobacter sp.]